VVRLPRAALVGRELRHPADRTEGVERSRFERLAESRPFLAGSPFSFAVCLLAILAWIVGLIVRASDRFEITTAGLVSTLTHVLVALLKNAELRCERAIQCKLDAIANSLLEVKRGDDGGSERDLEEAIGGAPRGDPRRVAPTRRAAQTSAALRCLRRWTASSSEGRWRACSRDDPG